MEHMSEFQLLKKAQQTILVGTSSAAFLSKEL